MSILTNGESPRPSGNQSANDRKFLKETFLWLLEIGKDSFTLILLLLVQYRKQVRFQNRGHSVHEH